MKHISDCNDCNDDPKRYALPWEEIFPPNRPTEYERMFRRQVLSSFVPKSFSLSAATLYIDKDTSWRWGWKIWDWKSKNLHDANGLAQLSMTSGFYYSSTVAREEIDNELQRLGYLTVSDRMMVML